ncbi:MAG: hypothetical protein RBU25_03030 [Lentisphaeria bacterium]|nr:hypothetical protein [Lentisphaeria bacterium]
MVIELGEHEEQLLLDALNESLRLAHAYRERVADEDSILLVQDLRAICSLLGVEALATMPE